MQPPLSSIAERGSASGEDSDEEEEEEGGWRSADIKGKPRDSVDESVIRSGYLWKKGERRKVPHCSISRTPEFLSVLHADLEETMVCSAASTFGLLQECS
jgi:hypothetical protein